MQRAASLPRLIISVLFMAAMIAGVTMFWLSRFDLSEKPKAGAPQPNVSSAQQSVVLTADRSGHFVTDVRINGVFIKGRAIAGAPVVILSLADARKLGLNPAPHAFSTPVRTDTGEAKAAGVTLKEVRIGPIVATNVRAAIVSSGLETTLIGMSFFKQLSGFEMKGGSLVLRQ